MRKKYLRHILFLMLLYCVIPAFVQGQNAYNSEADLKKQAAKNFDKEDYIAAYPLYSQLLSLYPKNGDYNYKFGVCILLSTGDKEKPIPYLEYASKQPDVDKDVFYYLAKAYHLNYRFDDAIAMYQKYKTVGSKSQIEKFQIDRQIAMCQNGKALLKSIKGLDVIDKKELTVEDYYLSYSLPDIGGKLLVEPDDFKTSYDKKKNVSSIIFLSNNHNQIYYSSYGKDGKNGKDIYVIRKLPNGDWSKPENVGAPINTPYDEDFPFLHPDGKELYFCSKGHNSMGGYDIFKSTWNDITKTWGEPVNLDFPINTPADDILYITDTDDKLAYFSSDRSSPDGKIMIYKINVARKPVDISIIKGDFVKTDDTQNIDSKITVQNMETNEIVGIYKVNETSGDYIMNLPNGGKFLFTVETSGFKTQSNMVSIPVQYELKPLKQEITYEKGTGKLIVKNMFDQPVDDNNYLLAMNYIKQRAKMDVNASSDTSSSKNNTTSNNAAVVKNNNTQNNNTNKVLATNQNSNPSVLKDSLESNDYNATNDSTESADNTTNDSTSTASNSNSTSDSSKINPPNLSNADIVKIAYNDSKESDKEAKDMQNQANAALAMANEKNEETKNKNAEANQLKAKADQIQDPTQKQSILDQYNESKKEANKLANATVAAFNIATQLQSDATAKRKEADFSQQYAKQLDNAVSSNSSNSDAALKQMASEKDSLDKMNQQPVGTDNVYNNLKSDVDNKQAEADDANQTLTNNQQQLANLNSNISQMQAQADTSSNNTLKQALQSQVSELKTERTQKQNDIVSESKRATELQEEASNLKDQLAVSNGMITQIKQGANNPANADVSSIDKQKLQAEVSSYKQVNVSDSSNLAESSNATNSENSTLSSASTNQQNDNSNNSIASDTTSDNLKNNSSVSDSTENVANNTNNNAQTTVSDSAANATNNTTHYAEKYSSAITEAEKITDDYNRDEAEAAIYSDWATAIKKDISDKQNKLVSITNKKDKKTTEKAIAGLQKEFTSKQLLSQQNTQNANAIKQSLASAKNNSANDSTDTNSNSQNVNTNLANNSNNSNSGNNNSTDSTNTQNNSQNGNATTNGNANLASNSNNSNSGNNNSTDSTNTQHNSQNGNATTTGNTNLASNTNNSTVSTNTQNNSQNGNATTTGNANIANNSNNANSGNNNSTDSTNTQNNSQNRNTTTGNTDLANNSTTSNSGNNNSTDSTNTQNNSQNGNATTTGNANLASNSNNSNSGNNNSTNSANAKNNSQNGNATTTGNTNLASNTNNANSGNNSSDLTVSSDQLYSSGDAKINNKQAEQSEQQAQTANDKHDSLMQQAASEKDTAQKVQLMADANAAQFQAQQAQVKAENSYAKADKIQNQKNNQEIAQLSQATASQNADDLLIASAMNDDAKTHFQNAQKDRDLATQSTDVLENQALLKQAHNEENTALIKQQKAIAIYSKYAPQVASQFNQQTQNQNANQTKTSQNNSQTNSQNNTVANNTQQSNTTANGSVTNQQTNTINSNITSANNEQIKKTPEYQKYITTINQSDSLEAIATNNFKGSDNYKKISEMEADSATKNTTIADTISNPDEKQQALQKVQDELNLATTNKNKSDSLKTLASQNQTASFSEKADAATYLSSLDTQTASNIKAASSESNNNQNVAVNNTNANSVNAPTGTSNSNENNSTAANNVATNSQKNASKNNSNNNQTGTNNLTANSNHANNTNTSTDNSTVNNSTANNTNNTTQNTTTISLTDTFEASQTPVYSANNPIPINPPLPNGVYFKVQVGAFRNKISQDLFKGMKPVIGETTPQGFIRYSAGMFTATDKANDAKNKIVAMGYKDAFVVAFINGKRVSMDKALAALNQPITANNNNQNATNSQNNIAENASNAAVSTDVVQVKGLFYTVQVGVYLRPVAASRLFNIQPLYSEKTANGFIRYNSGIFNDFDKATAAKNIIVNIGIKDAFVTAYYNGKRINPDKAKALIIAGSAQYTSDANVNEMPNQSNQANVQSQQQTENQTSVVTQPTTNPVTQTTTSTNTTNTNNSTLRTTTSDNKVVFKVQIGAYKNQIPLEIANKFLTLGGDGVKTNVDENGITIYTTGSFSAFNDAEQLKNKIVTEGIPDAFVTAFSNGKKITLDEAQKLIH